MRFQTALADRFPDFIVNPTKSIEESDAVANRLADLRGAPRFHSPSGSVSSGRPSSLPVLGRAPDFTDTSAGSTPTVAG